MLPHSFTLLTKFFVHIWAHEDRQNKLKGGLPPPLNIYLKFTYYITNSIISYTLALSVAPYGGSSTVFTLRLAFVALVPLPKLERPTRQAAPSQLLQHGQNHPSAIYILIFALYIVILILVTCTMLLLHGNHVNYIKTISFCPY